MSWTKEGMARIAAEEIAEGSVVNLGIGIPTLVADQVGDKQVWLHSENGILGMGPFPIEGQEDPQIINAGKQTVTIVSGGSTFDSATSFGMIRGGHVDLAILGAMQISSSGDIANWSIPGGKTMGIGGAMDLAAGAKRVLSLTRHLTKDGKAKLLRQCSFPLTAVGVVCRVITDWAVLDCAGDKFNLVRLAPGVTIEQLRAGTGAPVILKE